MALERVEGKRHESAVDFVVKTFRDKLEKKELRPGDRIPNETELSEMLSVSRGSVPGGHEGAFRPWRNRYTEGKRHVHKPSRTVSPTWIPCFSVSCL